MDFREGPDGLMLGYRGSGHAHGTAMADGGELVPTTEAWAGFGVVLDGVRSGFNVELLDFDDPAVEELFGYRFTVSAVSDSFAIVRVDRIGAADVEGDSGW